MGNIISHPRFTRANDNDLYANEDAVDKVLAEREALIASMEATVEYKGRVNKYHEAAELIQEYTKRLLDLWERR